MTEAAARGRVPGGSERLRPRPQLPERFGAAARGAGRSASRFHGAPRVPHAGFWTPGMWLWVES